MTAMVFFLVLASAAFLPSDGMRYAVVPSKDVTTESSTDESDASGEQPSAEELELRQVLSGGRFSMDAAQASSQATMLRRKGVHAKNLTDLYSALRENINGLGFGAAKAAKHAISLAIKRVDSRELVRLYQVLRMSSGGFGLLPEPAGMKAFELIHKKVDPKKLLELYHTLRNIGMEVPEARRRTWDNCMESLDLANVKAIYRALTEPSKLGMLPAEARKYVIWLALAGSVPETLVATYRENVKANGNPGQRTLARDLAFFNSVAGQPLVKRYSLNSGLLTAEEYLEQYGAHWLREWTKSPVEKRLAPCREALTAKQFADKYGEEWMSEWNRSMVAWQRRIPSDDYRPYTIAEYRHHYGDEWREQWSSSIEIPCIQCANGGKPSRERSGKSDDASEVPAEGQESEPSDGRGEQKKMSKKYDKAGWGSDNSWWSASRSGHWQHGDASWSQGGWKRQPRRSSGGEWWRWGAWAGESWSQGDWSRESTALRTADSVWQESPRNLESSDNAAGEASDTSAALHAFQ